MYFVVSHQIIVELHLTTGQEPMVIICEVCKHTWLAISIVVRGDSRGDVGDSSLRVVRDGIVLGD